MSIYSVSQINMDRGITEIDLSGKSIFRVDKCQAHDRSVIDHVSVYAPPKLIMVGGLPNYRPTRLNDSGNFFRPLTKK